MSGRSRANFVLGGLLAVAALGAILALLPMIHARTFSSLPEIAPQTTDRHWDVVGTITLPAEGAYCRQLALDNKTGAITPRGHVRCVEAGAGEPSADDGAGRLDAIRRSFSRQ
jgi:hypothetical protein